ncbi:MAG: hypothetical protein IJM82_00275 [Synergistaceae bacterium]|nr:hypothetical protein [Synergistaceae bacterium]
MKRKILFAVSILIFTYQTAFAINYPCVGYCYGNFVNLVDNPDINNSNVIGSINEGEMLIILDEAETDFGKFYKIENPFNEGTAWIHGNEIELEDEHFSKSGNYGFVIQVFQNFGLYPDKTKSIFGEPFRDLHDEIIDEKTFEYPDFRIIFVNDFLSRIEITGNKFNFGGVQVGNSIKQLYDVFGEPTKIFENLFNYKITERDSFDFYINGKGIITKMIYQLGD